jgi:hypothetical protein
MNTSVKIRFNGYYYVEEEGYEGNSSKALTFYEDGYVLIGWESKMREFYKMSLEKRENYFLGLRGVNWGKYRIEGDSIVIQYIAIDFPRGAWKFYQRATREYRGRIVNDTTIQINYQGYHKANTDEIEAEYEERTYRFKEYPNIPPSENWLMYEEEATVPTKRK